MADDLFDPFADKDFQTALDKQQSLQAQEDLGDTEWSDYALTAGSRTAGIGSDLSAAVRSIGETTDPDKGSSKMMTLLGEIGQKAFGDLSKSADESMSPAAQRDLAADVTDPNFWTASSIALKMTNTAPDIVAAAVPALLFKSVAASAVAGGALSASNMVNELYAKTDAMSDTELSEAAPLYKQMRTEGMDETEARRKYNAVLRGYKPLLAGAFGAITNSFTPGGKVAGLLVNEGEQVAEGVVKRVAKDATEGFLSEGAQEGTEEYLKQSAAVEGGLQQEVDVSAIVKNALTGATIGGVLGAGVGVVPRGSNTEATLPTSNKDIDVNLTGNNSAIPGVPDENVDKADTSAMDNSAKPVEVDPNAATTAQDMQSIKNYNKKYADLTPEQQTAVDAKLTARRLPTNAKAKKKAVVPTEQVTAPVENVQPIGPDAAQTEAMKPDVPETPLPVEQPQVTTEGNPEAAIPDTAAVPEQPVQDTAGIPVDQPVSQPTPEVMGIPDETGPVSAQPVDVQQQPAIPQDQAAMPVEQPVNTPVEEPVTAQQPVTVERVKNRRLPKKALTPQPVEETRPEPITAGSEPIVPRTTPRVLDDLTKVKDAEAIKTDAEKRLADNIKKMNEATAETERDLDAILNGSNDQGNTTAKISKKAREEIRANKAKAKEVFDAFTPNEVENGAFEANPKKIVAARAKIMERVRAIVAKAETDGVKLYKSLKSNTDKDMAPTAADVLLVEANELQRDAAKAKDGNVSKDRLQTFLKRELMLRLGEVDAVLEERREGGDAKMGRKVTRDDAAVSEEDTGPIDMSDEVSEDDVGEREEAAPEVEEESDSGIRERTARQIAKDKVPQSIDDALDEVLGAYTVPKEGARPAVVEKVKKRVIKKPETVTTRGNVPANVPAKRLELGDRIKAAREKTNTSPTPGQIESGNYAKGTVSIHGMPVAIETVKGGKREGTAADGTKWSVKLKHDYGYIKGTKGADGDQIDVYVGPNPDASHVYVIDQIDTANREFDEHKVMMGFKDRQAAIRAYDAAFSDNLGIMRIGDLKVMTMDEFKAWLDKAPAERNNTSRADAIEARSLMIDAQFEQQLKAEAYHTGKMREGFVQDPVSRKIAPVLQTLRGDEAMWGLDFKNMTGAPRLIAGTIRNKLTDLVGDVKVHIIDNEDINRLIGRNALTTGKVWGYHIRRGDDNTEAVFINADALEDPAKYRHVIMHELVHAATVKAIMTDKQSDANINAMISGVRSWLGQHGDKDADRIMAYGLTDTREFIAEAMSNPEFQEILAKIPISQQTAINLRLNAGIRNMWDAFISAVRRALKLPGNTHTMLEAAIRVTERTMIPELNQRRVEPDTNALRSFMVGDYKAIGRKVKETLDQIEQRSDLAPTKGNPHLMGFRTFDSIARAADRYFRGNNVIRKIADVIEGQRVSATKQVAEAAPIIQKLHDLQKRYSKVNGVNGSLWDDFTALVHDETMAGVFADRPLDQQKHISKSGARDTWARNQYPDLASRFNKMPADLKAARSEAMAYFTRKQNEMALKLIRNRIVTLFDTTDPEGLAQRIHDGSVTDADKDLMGEAYDAIKAAGSLAKIDGPYVPLMRRGNYVVKGTFKVTTPGNSTKLSENEFEFKSKEDAQKFMEGSELRPTLSTVYVDKKTGSTFGVENGKQIRLTAQDMNAEARYRVSVQDRYMEMFDTLNEARDRVASLRASGIDVDDAVPRAFENYGIQSDALSIQMRKMNSILERRADARGMTPEQKDNMMRTLNEMSLNVLGATRIQSRSLPRSYVKGASKDFTRNTVEYAHAAGNYIAKLDFRPQLDALLGEMKDAISAAPKDGYAQGRQEISNEVIRRITANNPIVENSKWNAVTSRILSLSFIDKLMSPTYSVINATQPFMITAPYLSSHYGPMRAYRALSKAYSDIGTLKTLKEGLAATVNKTVRGDQIPTDPVSLIKSRLSSKAERDFLDVLVDRGNIDTDSGLEVGAIVRSTKGIVGKLDGGIGYLEGIARQMPKTIEAINRTTTALAAYRLEMERSGDVAKATQFAQDTINLTQFNYSSSNAAPFMNHPALRLALQFKKYGLNMYQFLGEQAAIAIRNENPGDRARAVKALSYTIGMHVLMAGAMGLPTEPIKMLVMAANGLGITDWTWADIEDAQRAAAADLLGAEFGEIVSRGVPRALGIDLSTRMGIDTLVGPLGEPRSNEGQDWKAYMWDSVSGAPIGLVTDWAKGVNDLAEGDIVRAAERLIPIKMVADGIKAYRTYSEGTVSERSGKQVMSPYSVGEAVIKTLGLAPAREAESFERSSAQYRAKQKVSDAQTEFKRAWADASPATRGRVWRDIVKWNRTVDPSQRLSLKDLRSYQKRLKEDLKNTKEGIKVSRRDQAMQKRIDEVYNFEP